MDMLTFSVVTPNYNGARFLPDAIESVLANLTPCDQYFVIDGGSTDHSVEIIRRYEKHLSAWVTEPDGGYAEAIAKGFRRSTGELLCWVNSSDMLLPGALTLARRSLADAGADLIFGDDLYVDEHGRVLRYSSGRVASLRRMMLYGGWTPLQDACFWRRSLYERVGGIDPTLKYAADYDFFLRASSAGRCVYVPRLFSAFRRHLDQKSTGGAIEYECERQICRQRRMSQLGVSLPQRWPAERWYWLAVRWRHHIARRLLRSPVPPGTLALEVLAR